MTGDYQQAQSGAASTTTPQAVPVSFGTYRLSPVRERLRVAGNRLPANWVGRKLNSVFRDLCILGRAAPYDVEVFPDEYARLHPADNRCEKRTLCGTQFWDREERTYLQQMIADTAGDTEFVFVDAGANVGLYTLYTRSVARDLGCKFRALAIEPDATNGERLSFNLAQNDYGRVDIYNVALGENRGFVGLTVAGKNRGEIRLDEATETKTVPLIPLDVLASEFDLDHINALKIDVEGYEEKVLRPFFQNAPQSLWPQAILIETAAPKTPTPAIEVCFKAGYEVHTWTHMNAILTRSNSVDATHELNG